MLYSLRRMKLEDAESISALSKQLGYGLDVDETKDLIGLVNNHPDHIALVIADEKKQIGWIHAFKTLRIESKPFIEIGGLVVDENYRGKGVGKLLINAIKNWSEQEEISTIRVRCHTKRKEAHLFYNKLGFSESKEQKIFEIRI
jgi:GNAT superfamily N-acetyltransferase